MGKQAKLPAKPPRRVRPLRHYSVRSTTLKMFVFGGKKLTPKEQQRKWQKDLRKQHRALEKQTRENKRHEKKVKAEIKKYAKSGDIKIVKTLAKDVVKCRKSNERLYTAQAQIKSVGMQLKSQAAMAKVTDAMGKGNTVMKSMR